MAARVLGQTRRATWDALPVAIALAHGALLLAWPSIPLVAIGLWWNANTISHHAIHRPFFRTRTLNAGFSCYLSLLLGFPQSLWRARHLAHHLAIEGRRGRTDLKVATSDTLAVVALWVSLLVVAPGFLLTVYVPAFLLGLGLCYLQGHYEHARGTVSHYGLLYNFLLFNDGYHVEHHSHPGMHWQGLPRLKVDTPQPDGLIPIARGQDFAIRAVARDLGGLLMPLQPHSPHDLDAKPISGPGSRSQSTPRVIRVLAPNGQKQLLWML